MKNWLNTQTLKRCMRLSSNDKLKLEDIVDDAISHIQREKKTFSNTKVKNLFRIYDINDFLFGMIYGEITTHFEDYYSSKHSRIPDQTEVSEILDILTNRLKEIREILKGTE